MHRGGGDKCSFPAEAVWCPNPVGTALVPEALSLQCKQQRILSGASAVIENNNSHEKSGKTNTPEKCMCYASHFVVTMPS